MPPDPPTHAYPLAPGTVVDRKYSVERILGEGGMGVVYLARDLLTETHVVLKAIRSAYARQADYRDRILTEGRALARIDHPHVVRLNAIVVEEDALYLVMQYIEGESVEGLLHRHEGRPVPVAEAARIFRQAAEGVAAAHREGIIHRDIKPANILIRARDGAIKVTDFGIAKDEEDAKLGRGKTRGVIGSAPYMAPEQCIGKVIDKRVDIYSLGVVLYELLTGRLPFESDSLVDMMMQHVKEDVPSVLPVRPDVPPELDAVLLRACARKPEDRFASCEDLLAALDRALGSEASHTSSAGLRVSSPGIPQAPEGATTQPSTVPGAPPFQPAAPRPAPPPFPAGSPGAPPAASPRGSSWTTLRLGLLLGLVGGLGVLGAFGLGLIGSSSDPEKKPSASQPPPSSSSSPRAEGSASPRAQSSARPATSGPDLSGAWTSDSGRAYDVVFHAGAYEFRIRDAAQFPEQGYEAGEARFRLRPIAGEMETYLVEDRIRPFPPEGSRYDASKARESCVEVWTEIGGRPLRAQLDGARLWVRMARVEPAASNFSRQGSLVVGCAGLREARASEVDSFLTRTK
ncbi:MAG TPA: serine/threonine-protein kinase [Polyangiaceae bacterium]|nr:serine/threonine-protein kinase [Polyangiaceae bacterium]